MFLTDIVIGLQHGDEGKGKVSYNLLHLCTFKTPTF